MTGESAPGPEPRRRIGLVIPSSNVVMEDLLQDEDGREPFRAARFHVARLPVEPVDLGEGSAAQFETRALIRTASPLSDARVDAMIWAGTAGLWLGLDRDRQIAAALAQATGVPVSTTAIETVRACRRIEARRIALLTPFLGEVQQAIIGVLAAEGIEVAAEHHFGLGSSRLMAEIPEADIVEAARRIAGRGLDALCCICTNMRVPPSLLYGFLPIPVIDSARESLNAMIAPPV